MNCFISPSWLLPFFSSLKISLLTGNIHLSLLSFFFFFINLFIILFYLFIYFGCIGSSLLRAGFFSGCGEQGLLFTEVHGLLIVVASLVAEHGL